MDGEINQSVAGAILPIPTTGEVFNDGTLIDLISDPHDGDLGLALWDGGSETRGPLVEHNNRIYKPAPIDSSVLRALTLPANCSPHGTSREFLTEISNMVTHFVGVPERSAALVGRLVLCTAIVDALSTAPMLIVNGPDIGRGNQLVALLRCLCRHPLQLTGVTPAGLCSLVSGARFTYLINQSSLSDKLLKLLDYASARDQKIPVRGRLLDLFGVQIVHGDLVHGPNSWPARSILVSVTPTGQELPPFDLDIQHRIAGEFQPKLLSFRRSNLSLARRIQFDTSKFSFPLRDLARSLAAATPDDPALQAEVFDLLRDQDTDVRSERWTELSSVALEAIVVAADQSPGQTIYVASLAEIAQEILRRRGDAMTVVKPAVLGKRLKMLGFTTEPRDSRGTKLVLSDTVVRRAIQLARDLGGPEMEDDEEVEE